MRSSGPRRLGQALSGYVPTRSLPRILLGDALSQTGLVILTTPHLSLEEARTSFQPFAEFAASVNGTVIFDDTPSWLTFFNKYITGNVRRTALFGT